MTAGPGNAQRGARQSAPRGFTMIELVAVMVVAGIMAALATTSLNSLGASRAAAAAAALGRDVAFARERAMATGTRHWVLFSPGTDSYSVLIENPASPGYAGAATLTDPASGSPFVVRIADNQPGVDLVSASFDSALAVGFDWLGQPLAIAGTPLTLTASVSISGGHSITLNLTSGLLTHVGP